MPIRYKITSWWKRYKAKRTMREQRQRTKKNFDNAKRTLNSLKQFPR